MTDEKTVRVYPGGDADYAVPPGETIREFLDELGMSQRELALRLDLSPKHVNQLLQGLVPLSPEVAVRLELVTGVPARLWNRLEADYRSTSQRLRKRLDLAESTEWLRELPIRELKRRGALPAEADSPAEQVQQALAFFGVAHITTYRELYECPAASFRQTKAFKADPGAVAAWLRLGELTARNIKCAPFDRRGLQDSLGELRRLTQQPPSVAVRLMADICARHGVAIAVVPEIKGARVSGATKWLASNKVMILLSGRYKADDHVWFTFFHEIGHALKHGKTDVWIEDDRASGNPEEEEADRFAQDLLIPPEDMRRLPGRPTLATVERFASDVGIAPGIVVGRLHREKRLAYHVGNKLLQKIDFTEVQ